MVKQNRESRFTSLISSLSASTAGRRDFAGIQALHSECPQRQENGTKINAPAPFRTNSIDFNHLKHNYTPTPLPSTSLRPFIFAPLADRRSLPQTLRSNFAHRNHTPCPKPRAIKNATHPPGQAASFRVLLFDLISK